MSEKEKIDLQLAMKVWGGLISGLLVIIISLVSFIYLKQVEQQEKINNLNEVRWHETQSFRNDQRIMNNVFIDLLSDVDPTVQDKVIPYFQRHSSLNSRSVSPN